MDDRIPCRRGTREPLFAKPHGAELWTMVLEKAVAKFCGSYAALAGGFSVWAWQVMTGDPVCTLWYGGGVWKRKKMVPAAEGGAAGRRAVRFAEDGAELTDDALWKLLCTYDRQGALLGASRSKSGPGGGGPCGEQVPVLPRARACVGAGGRGVTRRGGAAVSRSRLEARAARGKGPDRIPLETERQDADRVDSAWSLS